MRLDSFPHLKAEPPASTGSVIAEIPDGEWQSVAMPHCGALITTMNTTLEDAMAIAVFFNPGAFEKDLLE
jgi:hypothetical protein